MFSSKWFINQKHVGFFICKIKEIVLYPESVIKIFLRIKIHSLTQSLTYIWYVFNKCESPFHSIACRSKLRNISSKVYRAWKEKESLENNFGGSVFEKI